MYYNIMLNNKNLIVKYKIKITFNYLKKFFLINI